MKIVEAHIDKAPRNMVDAVKEGIFTDRVVVLYDNGDSEALVSFYHDELSFSPDEFIGLTRMEALQLWTNKDTAYLRS